MQAMGENVLGLVLEYSRLLRNGTNAMPATGKLIFFDVLGLFMVRDVRTHLVVPRKASCQCRDNRVSSS